MEDLTSYKVCKRCNEFQRHSKNKSLKDGLSFLCTACKSKENKDWMARQRADYNSNRNKNHYLKNQEYMKAKRSAYKKSNRALINKQLKKRNETDMQYKLSRLLRKRLLKVSGKIKSGSAVKDLGCTLTELKAHLEGKFHNNLETGEVMTWENHRSIWLAHRSYHSP